MATSLAAQLAQIAAKSKISLDAKAQKASHSKSLLFEPRVAAAQNFRSIYAICREGFDELCQLDERFVLFGNTLFSEASIDEDRTQCTAAENAELDRKIEAFLRLNGARLRLLPAIRAVEWLIRRFQVHELNTAALITTFLPYHSIPVFVTLLSILPRNIPHEFLFLSPYIRSLIAPPRAAIVQHAARHFDLLTTLSSYTLEACRERQQYPGLVTFWGGIMTEAVSSMLDTLKSGRRTVQIEHDLSVLHQVGPILGDAVVIKAAPGIQIAAYMALSVLAVKANLSDGALSSFMEQVVTGWSPQTVKHGLVCLSILAQQRSGKQLSRKVAKAMLKVPDLPQLLVEIGQQRRIDKLANGLVLALTEHLAKKATVRSLPIIKSILMAGILHEKQLVVAFKALLLAAHSITDEIDADGSARKELGTTLILLSQAPAAAGGDVIRRVIEDVDFDIEELELKLDTSIRRPMLLASAAAATATAAGADADTAMADGDAAAVVAAAAAAFNLDAAVARLAQLKRPASCLADDADAADVFDQFCQLFIATAAHDKADLETLDAAPLLGRADAVSDCFYLSFCMRMWSGPYPTLARVAALDMAAKRLQLDDCAGVDFQAVLPYCIAALSDPAKKVRRAAAGLMEELRKTVPQPASTPKKQKAAAKSSSPQKACWGAEALYTQSTSAAGGADNQPFLSAEAQSGLVALVSESLAESILYEDHLPTVLAEALDKSSSTSKNAAGEGEQQAVVRLSHSVRLAILAFLASHTVRTPLLRIQLRLLKSLNEVRGVSGTTRTQLLLPVLARWASLSAADARRLAAKEDVDEAVADARSVDVVIPNDKDGLECLFGIIQGPRAQDRPGLVRCVFRRIRKMWPVMKEDFCSVTAQLLLEQVQKPPAVRSSGPDDQPDAVAEEAAELLHNVELSTAVLSRFLDSLQHAAKMATDAPPNKRRRTSSSSEHNRGQRIQANRELRQLLNRATFVLQLIQGARPAEHPELLPGLFVVLSDLQILRSYVGSELGYLQNVVLGCLLAMMPAYQANKSLKIDTSVGHGDVLVNCIHKSSSPAVQNTALLLVAALAKTAPDVVLHSVMPIFTLMGTSVLRQNDDYSAHVVNQTIREVIPPLIDTFKRGKRNVVASAADLLASFVIAYEHIPPHRRHGLFLSLIENLGANDFLFALIAMFADRYGTAEDTCAFLTELLATFPVEVQLQSLIKFVGLVADTLKPKPGLSATILGKKDDDGDIATTTVTVTATATAAAAAAADDEQEALLQRAALKELTLLPQLLGNRRLKDEISHLDEADDDMATAKTRELYVQLLDDILTLADTIKTLPVAASPPPPTTAESAASRKQQLHNRCGDALAQLLNLQSISEFIKAVEVLLDRPNMGVRQKVLRALELRVDEEGTGTGTRSRGRDTAARSRAALLAFLPQLTAVLRDSDDVAYKHTAVTCVDKIAEKYGRRDLEAVTAAATAIAGDACLGQPDRRLRVMALLCLASLVDVLQDAIVPVLPVAVPRALSCLQESLGLGAGADRKAGGVDVDLALHNAAYAFLTALAQHLPFMMTGAHLDRLLGASFASAEAGLAALADADGSVGSDGSDGNAIRMQCLQLLAKQVDAKTMFDLLQRNWQNAAKAGQTATLEFVQILTTTIDRHGKSVIVKNLPALSATFQNAFDLRRETRLRTGNAAAAATATATATAAAAVAARAVEVQLAATEAVVNTACLHMVFKLNDAAFRPVFAGLVDWSSNGLPQLDVLGRSLRQQSLYGFLHLFFDRLKGAVTSYAAYILDDAAAALRAARLARGADDRALWTRVLQTLTAAFVHDAADDGTGSSSSGFWQAPAHFETVAPALVEQFAQVAAARSKGALSATAHDELLTTVLIPAVVALARAASAADHQKALNGLLLQRLQATAATATAAERVGVIQCQQALADAVGEEWLAQLPEMLPLISELQETSDEAIDRETNRWINKIEEVLGESLDAMLQ